MPRIVTEITIFLASPGDVKRERVAVRKAAEEVNRTTGEHDGFHLNVKGWETHTRPTATKKGRAQDAIFEQIGDYDIFVGVMWARVGTPTGKADSGTIEEYEAARQQWSRRRKNKPSVMFYFRKNLTAAIDALDTDQLKAVQTFKKRVFGSGLAREYSSVSEFESLIREHLTKEARAILKRFGASTKAPRFSASPTAPASPAKKPAVKKAHRQTRSAGKTPRAPRLSVPEVPRLLNDADREAFARKALNTALREFRVAAKAFNTRHGHAKITVKQEGRDSFTATGEANGEPRVSARIRLEKPSWGSSWTLHYETAHFGFSFDGTPHYQSEIQVQTTDDKYTSAYVGSYGTFSSANGRTQLPIDVARVFWERLIRPMETRQR